MSSNNKSASGVGFGALLLLLFVGLKLGHVIDWPWIWVLAPLWGPWAVLLAVVILAVLGGGAVTGFRILTGHR